jgi:hypothetical protein
MILEIKRRNTISDDDIILQSKRKRGRPKKYLDESPQIPCNKQTRKPVLGKQSLLKLYD